MGLLLRAIRGDEATCQAAGINVTFYKIASLMISAAFAGLGGALYAHYQLQVSPPLFSVVVSITIIIMVYVGGIGSIYGPVRGAILLTLLTEMLRGFGEYRLLDLHADPDAHPVLPAQRPRSRRYGGGCRGALSDERHSRSHQDVSKRFGGLTAVKDVRLLAAAGRTHRCPRPQWRRQDHAVQPPDRLHCRGHRLDPVRGTGIYGDWRPTRSSTAALPEPFS